MIYRYGQAETDEVQEWARYDMFALFADSYAPYLEKSNFSTELINNGVNNQSDSIHDSSEANLDIQYGAAMSYDTSLKFYSIGGRGQLVPDLE